MKSISIIIFFLSITTSNSLLFSQTNLEEIIGDMNLPHEGRPHGVPDNYNWAINPRRGAVEPPADWTAAIAWGQLYEWIEGNPADNTRVHLTDLELYYLNKNDNKWYRIQKAVRVSGAAYREDFAGDDNIPADIRLEPDYSVSVTCGNGRNFHFWPNSGRVSIPKNVVAGCFVTIKARLIADDPLKEDDRDSARYVLSVGGDWWLSLTAQWDNWTTNADMGIGRFRFVGKEWRSFNMYSVTDSTIRNNPPPFPQENTSQVGFVHDLQTNLQLNRIYTNTLSDEIQVEFSIPFQAGVQMNVYDVYGRMVDKMEEGTFCPGNHSLYWSISGYNPGIYFIELTCKGQREIERTIVMR